MKEEKWEEALVFHTKAVEYYGSNQPLQLFGPRFGEIYYRKGITEMKLGKWEDAVESFEICYRDFPNAENAVGRENKFDKVALLKWAESAMGGGDYEQAISQYQKFLKERDPERVHDSYAQGPFHIGMAISHYKLGKIPEGNEHLEIAIKNKTNFPTPETAIVAGFQELVLSAITKRNEQALLDFIEKNRGELIIDPYLMHQYSPVFLKLAGDAIAAEMDRAALALYQFVPSTDAAIDDVRARLKSLGPLPRVADGGNVLVRQTLEKDLATLEEIRRGKRAPEMIKLAAAAFLNEKMGNARGAYASYLQLEEFFPASERREDNLFNLIRTSSLVGNAADTHRFAQTFVKAFPDSKHIPAVRRMMLSVLFYDGEYDTCIEIGAPMLDQIEAGTPEHDILLHVLGGSYFYTGQHEKAQPLLDQHAEKHPKSPFALSSSYFRAANQSRLQNWSKAASLLDEFLKNYPDASKNIFMAYALYDRATTHFAEEQPEPALEKIARIVSEFPNSNVLDQAYLLRGNIEQSLENNDRAEQAFKSALEAAEKLKHPGVAAEALYSLVVLLGQPDNPRLKEAVPFADRYWESYASDSPFKSRMAVAQFAALSAVDRAQDGLKRLRGVVSEMARQPENPALEPLINSYTEAYLTQHTPDELKEHYYNFEGIRIEDRAARALLRVALIGVFENELRKTQDEAKKRAGEAMIKVLFQELKTDFALKDLTNFILVKVGDYLRNNTATPREALPYYDEALGREDKTMRFAALLGRADVYGNSGVAADIEKALKDFETVYNESEEKAEREFSLFRMIELLIANKEYAKAAEKAQIYLDREKSGFSKFSPQVGLLLARTFDERKMVDDAIAMYVKVWSAHMGNIKISAPAMKRWMELSWQRNKESTDPATPSDRQGAYEGGARFIELTGRFRDKMTESDLKLWQEVEALVQTYEANPNIKSMAQIKAEKEAAQRRRR
jgi:tetratricopeptide (TPR) repeat protein